MRERVTVMAGAVIVAVFVGAALFAILSSDADKPPRDESASRSDSEPARETIYAGVARGRGTIELAGAIVAYADVSRSQVEMIQVDIVLSEGAEAISFDGPTDRPIPVTYIDGETTVVDVSYTVTPITGDTDAVLEWPENYRLTLDVADVARNLRPGGVFTLEFRPPNGSFMVVQRALPGTLEAVNELN